MTQLVIFDMDHVLYDYDWDVRIAGLAQLTGLAPSDIKERWWDAGFERQAEAGYWPTGDEYIDAFSRAIGVPVARQDWVRIRGAAMSPRPEAIAAVARAAEIGTVTLLTNNGSLVGESLDVLAPALVDVFGEHLLTSSAYGARKPDPQVFLNVLERYETPAADAFFADDLTENVAGAASVGITAHLYTTPSGLLDAIENFAAVRA
ncbi:MAG: HAD family hydrolase [Glaciihabitans sp.]